MSTRANIVIKDNHSKLFFYRHSDGYPEGTMPTLNIFMDWLKAGKIRNNVGQAAGWIIVLGAIEYAHIPDYEVKKEGDPKIYQTIYGDLNSISQPRYWKVGAFEPTTGIHGDIEYLYVIDLSKKKITCFEDWTEDGEGKGTPIDLSVKDTN